MANVDPFAANEPEFDPEEIDAISRGLGYDVEPDPDLPDADVIEDDAG